MRGGRTSALRDLRDRRRRRVRGCCAGSRPTRAASSPTPSTSASTSDYVFRGISQNDNDPTIQGGIDLGYGILYAGVWASGINFDAIVNDADLEVDWYGGIKPTWGPATFDFGVIYYTLSGRDLHHDPAVRF